MARARASFVADVECGNCNASMDPAWDACPSCQAQNPRVSRPEVLPPSEERYAYEQDPPAVVENKSDGGLSTPLLAGNAWEMQESKKSDPSHESTVRKRRQSDSTSKLRLQRSTRGMTKRSNNSSLMLDKEQTWEEFTHAFFKTCCGAGTTEQDALKYHVIVTAIVTVGIVVIPILAIQFSRPHPSGSPHPETAHTEYTPYDGFYNNPAHPEWGSGETELVRITPPAYADKAYQPSGADRAEPRSLATAANSGNTGKGSYLNISALCTFYGQQVVEEILDAQRPGCPIEYFNINIPKGDPQYDPSGKGDAFIPFLRGRYNHLTGHGGSVPRQQLNEISSFIDGSLMYGPFKAWTDAIRSFKDGTLATTSEETISGEFPSLNKLGLPYANPPPPEDHKLRSAFRFWTIGNPRGNENPMLLSMGIVWFRYHNFQARRLKLLHPDWTDEQLFNEARKWTVATHQHITVNEWFPAFANTRLKPYTGYKPNVHPGILQEFQSAAMRYGHTLVPPGVWLRTGPEMPGASCDFNFTRKLRTCKTFWRAQEIIREVGGVEPILRGLASQITEREDHIVVPSLRGFVFGTLQNSRRDLMALNIQRGRDHGLPDFNTIRATYGLQKIKTLEELFPDKPNQTVIQNLKDLGVTVDNLDLWVGGILGSGRQGPGDLFKTILRTQFENVRDGDRFWYNNTANGLFTDEEIAQIHAVKFSHILLNVTNIKPWQIQEDVFHHYSPDVCPQPWQLSAEELEPCSPNKGFNYWAGSKALPFLFIFGLLFIIFALVVWKRGVIVKGKADRRWKALHSSFPPRKEPLSVEPRLYIGGLQPPTDGKKLMTAFHKRFQVMPSRMELQDTFALVYFRSKSQVDDVEQSINDQPLTYNERPLIVQRREIWNNYAHFGKVKHELEEEAKEYRAARTAEEMQVHLDRLDRMEELCQCRAVVRLYDQLTQSLKTVPVILVISRGRVLYMYKYRYGLLKDDFPAMCIDSCPLASFINVQNVRKHTLFRILYAEEATTTAARPDVYVLLDYDSEIRSNVLLSFPCKEELNDFKSVMTTLVPDVKWTDHTKGGSWSMINNRSVLVNMPQNRTKLLDAITIKLNGLIREYNDVNGEQDASSTVEEVLLNLETEKQSICKNWRGEVDISAAIHDVKYTMEELTYILNLNNSPLLAERVFEEAFCLSFSGQLDEHSAAAVDVRNSSELVVLFQGLVRLLLYFTSHNAHVRGKIVLNILMGRKAPEAYTIAAVTDNVALCLDPVAAQAGLNANASTRTTRRSTVHQDHKALHDSVLIRHNRYIRRGAEEVSWEDSEDRILNVLRAVQRMFLDKLGDSENMNQVVQPEDIVNIVWNVPEVDTLNKKHKESKGLIAYVYGFLLGIRKYFSKLYDEMKENPTETMLLLVFLFAQIYICWSRWEDYAKFREHRGMRRILGLGVSITRAAASEMMLCMDLLLISMSKNVLTMGRDSWLGRYIPFDKSYEFHKISAYALAFWTAAHCIGHLFNFYNIVTQPVSDLTCTFRQVWHYSTELPHLNWWLFQTMTGFTGVCLIVVLLVMYTFAHSEVRQVAHSFFMNTHQLFYAVYILSWLHGAYALVQIPDYPYWIFVPALIFAVDRLLVLRVTGEACETSGRVLPADVVELRIKRPAGFSYTPGQYVNIVCAETGSSDKHPFTIASAPYEAYIRLYIRTLGPWTESLRDIYRRASVQNLYPTVTVEGPYGEGHQDWFKYEEVVLVGAGIGVTPFASILADISNKIIAKHQYQTSEVKNTIVPKSQSRGFSVGSRTDDGRRIAFDTVTKKLHFIWVCRDRTQWEWLEQQVQRVIKNLERVGLTDFFYPYFYVTQGRNKAGVPDLADFTVQMAEKMLETHSSIIQREEDMRRELRDTEQSHVTNDPPSVRLHVPSNGRLQSPIIEELKEPEENNNESDEEEMNVPPPTISRQVSGGIPSRSRQLSAGAIHLGRPEFKKIFQTMKMNTQSSDIAVFTCAGSSVVDSITSACSELNKKADASGEAFRFFEYHQSFGY